MQYQTVYMSLKHAKTCKTLKPKNLWLGKIHADFMAFYVVNNGIGYIPCEMDFTYRNKRYTTMDILNKIANLKTKPNLHFLPNYWLENKNKKFIKLSIYLHNLTDSTSTLKATRH